MPKLEDLLNNFLYPLLVAFFMPLATILGSQLTTGDYTKWINQIPFLGKVVFIVVIILWLGIILIRKRLKVIEPSGVGAFSVSRWGYEDIGAIDFGGVKWRVIAPLPPPPSLHRGPDLTPSRIRISTPPRCPVCETKIEESKSFWGGYVWNCPSCDFKKRSWRSYHRVEDSVEKIAQRWVEKQFYEK